MENQTVIPTPPPAMAEGGRSKKLHWRIFALLLTVLVIAGALIVGLTISANRTPSYRVTFNLLAPKEGSQHEFKYLGEEKLRPNSALKEPNSFQTDPVQGTFLGWGLIMPDGNIGVIKSSPSRDADLVALYQTSDKWNVAFDIPTGWKLDVTNSTTNVYGVGEIITETLVADADNADGKKKQFDSWGYSCSGTDCIPYIIPTQDGKPVLSYLAVMTAGTHAGGIATIKLHPRWKPASHTINFGANGGELEGKNIKWVADYGTPLSDAKLKVTPPAGKTKFIGWFRTPAGLDAEVTQVEDTELLFARYE